MKVIITGATGMVGKGVLLECLEDEQVESVLSIGRSPLTETHSKLQHIQHNDFFNFEALENEIKGYDACFLCMGVSSAGMSETEYTKITFDSTVSLAKQLLVANSNMICVYVSGAGTDSSEKRRSMWARVKGRTENTLVKLGFSKAYMFRPGAIIPLKGIESRTKLYQFIYDYFMWLVKFVKFISPKSVVSTEQIGQAMIEIVKSEYKKQIVDPADIIELADRHK